MIFGRLLLVASISVPLLGTMARAERVGYSFTGILNKPAGPTQSWFGMQLDSARPLTGTFSYDTTVVGVEGDSPSALSYHQLISGGYSLDVDFGTRHVVVQASDYQVTVANNLKANASSPPTDQFVVNYTYFGAQNITPKKLRVDGAEWQSDFALIILGLFWDQNTFDVPDALELAPDRPDTPDFGVIANAVSSATVAPTITFVQVSPISPQAGDYNRNGKIDANDYIEWRNTFGMTGQDLPADGNHDGIIDGGDYIIWRKTPGSALAVTSIPEPGGLTLLVSWIILFIGSGKPWQRGTRRH